MDFPQTLLTRRIAILIVAASLTSQVELPAQTQYTTGYQPHFRPEAPGTLLYRSPIPELGGRLTNIIYHQGWLMTGFENPGSDKNLNDLRFRVMDISNLENDPVPVPFWPSDFGLDYGTNGLGREHWYTGNWGYNTHGHGRTATHVHWPVVRVESFGGAVLKGIDADAVGFSYGWGGYDGGRLRRQLPWGAGQDWAYGSNNKSEIHVWKAWRDNPAGAYNAGNYTQKPVGWVPGGQYGVRGFPEMLGDKFFINSDQRMSGMAIYQIPDDVLENYPNVAAPEMDLVGVSTEEFGGYWPEFWASSDGRLYSVGAVSGSILVMDLTDLSDPKLHRVFSDRGDGQGIRVRNAQYPKFQDDYLLIEKYVIDMEALVAGAVDPVVLELEHPAPVSGVWRQGFDPSQFSFPLGNLIVTGGYGSHSGGLFIHVRQQAPDTTPPTVRYHIPEADRTNYSRHMPINVIIHEELDSRTLNNGENFMIRKVVDSEPTGDPIDVIFNLGSNNVMTLTPTDPLEADTTYQVDFPSENGVMDISGNRIVDYSWRFSTGSSVEPEQPVPTINSFSVAPLKTGPGEPVTINAVVEDTGPFQYRIDYGAGAGFGSWVDVAAGLQTITLQHAYSEIGRYDVRFQVQDNYQIRDNAGESVLVYEAPNGTPPTRSSPIVVASDGRVWAVNPDANTVAVLNGETGALIAEYPVGNDPRGIAEDSDGRLWVTCYASDEIYLLDSAGETLEVLGLEYGDAPFGVVASPDGGTMYVSAYGGGGLYQFDTSATGSPIYYPLGETPRALAVDGDHSFVLVTRFISNALHGEVWKVDLSGQTVSTIRVEYDDTPDGSNSGEGVPNYLNGISISPDGESAVVVGVKSNVLRGEAFGKQAPGHENTLRTTVAVLDLQSDAEVIEARRDLDNSDSPAAVCFSPDGTMLFIAVQGNNQVQVLDALDLQAPVSDTQVKVLKNTGNSSDIDPSGLAPQGLVINPDNNRLYTQNFMSRSVTTFDVSAALDENQFNFEQVAEVGTVAIELLDSEVLLGKQIFYNASDERMSAESYISCASCHVDGGHDGQTWDFTHRGEGLRNTTDLRGRAGTGHGNVHWTANFDEIQDFELDISNHFGGFGFLEGTETANPSLGAPNAGRSDALDALAAYVRSLVEAKMPSSPYRQSDGTHTPEAELGAQVFTDLNCASCHRPDSSFTDSTLGTATLHNVGTLRTTSGNRLGGPLNGIDTPTLLGLWDGAPYLHDGSAANLAEVFSTTGGATYPAEAGVLDGASLALTAQIEEDYKGSSFGGFVIMDAVGESFVLEDVDGGGGGIGAIELRAHSSEGANVTVSVNGQNFSAEIPAGTIAYEWSRVRVEGVELQAGGVNEVSVTNADGGEVAVDSVTVATAAVVAAADAHREVLDLPGAEQNYLLRFLYELDRDWSGPEIFPVPPAELAALAVDEDQINLMFVDGTALETGYIIQYREVGGTWQEIPFEALAGMGASGFYEFVGLTPGVEYEFRVAAVSGEVQTVWSDVISETPLAAPSSDPIAISPEQDAYIENGTAHNSTVLKVEDGTRISYVMYDVAEYAAPLLTASFRFTVVTDGNNRGGTFRITEGSHSNWTENNLTPQTAPALSSNELADVDGNRAAGQTYEVPLNGLEPGLRTLILEKVSGGDFWMSSKEGSNAPQLILQYAEGEIVPPDGPVITTQPADVVAEPGTSIALSVEATARPEVAFLWHRDGVPLVDDDGITGANTASLSISPVDSSTPGEYTVLVRDLAGSATSSPATVSVPNLPMLDDWREEEFPDDVGNPAVSGDLADPDFDNIANILEFLQALDPHAAQPGLQPRMVDHATEKAFEFRVRKDPGDVSYEIKYSTDLVEWFTVDPEDIHEVSDVNGVLTLHVRQDIPAQGKVFYRIEAVKREVSP